MITHRPRGGRGKPWRGHRADRTTAARERQADRSAAGDAGCGRRAAENGVPGRARPRPADGLHRRGTVAPGELVPENNTRSVLVQPPSRVRHVLFVEGAPGFEHSFLKRAWAADSGLDVDSIVRKGKNEQGADTFYIQASRSRTVPSPAGIRSGSRILSRTSRGACERRGRSAHTRAAKR